MDANWCADYVDYMYHGIDFDDYLPWYTLQFVIVFDSHFTSVASNQSTFPTGVCRSAMCAVCSSEEPTSVPPVAAVYLTSAEEEITGEETPAPAGPLPGKSALDEAKAGMKGLDLGLAIELPKTSTTSLPFQVGGVGQVASSLPFGVGASAGVISDTSNEEIPTSESQTIVEQPVDENCC